MSRSKVIQAFLQNNAVKHLRSLYDENMEVQVNFAQDGAQVEFREGRSGRKSKVYSDGLTSWADFRMPRNAMGKPEKNDYDVKYDFTAHVDSIGLTGWDWVNGVSKWVGFDFDSIVGHIKAGLTPQQLSGIVDLLTDIPWVTIQRSTSGNGLHVYVYMDPVRTDNHVEHAALARALLNKLSALTGSDLSASVDVCGQVLWVWSRRQNPEKSFELVKEGRKLKASEVPMNWREHINVVKGSSTRAKVGLIPDQEIPILDQLIGQYPRITLDPAHKALMQYLQDNNCVWWWDNDMYMLVTHTMHLKAAHAALRCKGFYDTDSSHSTEQNCFAFPLKGGGWVVRRHGKGIKEHRYWDIDPAGWTRIFFNKEPSLETAARVFNGKEHPKGGFFFSNAENAGYAMQALGLSWDVHNAFCLREVRVFSNNKGKIVAEMPRSNLDEPTNIPEWIAEKSKFVRVLGDVPRDTSAESEGSVSYDDFIRHLVSETNQDAGWVVNLDDSWRTEPLNHIQILLYSRGLAKEEVTEILGKSVSQAWRLVNKPFQPEYVGNRQWNREGAKLRYAVDKTRTQLSFNTWRSILEHCGKDLDEAVKYNDWCIDNNVVTGADYLAFWCASLFQYPERPLPYLFFFGDQNSGKSTFHEALELLFDRGYCMAKQALISTSGFNGELEGAVMCVVEEIDLSVASSLAYNRIKEWVTNKQMLIHPKGKQPYQIANMTHWVQCANSSQYCPVFPDDSRIVVIETFPLNATAMMPRYELQERLVKEASDFLTYLFTLKIPHTRDRLNVPVVKTSNKELMASHNATLLEAFLSQECFDCPGNAVSFKDFYEKFQVYLDPSDRHYWTKNRVSRSLPNKFPSGALARFANQKYVGNVAFRGSAPVPKLGEGYEIRYIFNDGNLYERKIPTNPKPMATNE
jgi:hypothetical protein